MHVAQAAIGFTRTPSEDDPRRDPHLLAALGRIAPGTDLRQGIDDIIRSREGALIVIGDPNELSFLFSGGIRLDVPFTSQLVYEVAKIDGAIIVNPALTKLARDCVELGAAARLIQMQLDELVGEVPAERASVVYDYHADGPGPHAEPSLEGLHALSYRRLLEPERLVELLGYPRDVNPLDHSVSSRGFRILARIPRLPEGVVKKVVKEM